MAASSARESISVVIVTAFPPELSAWTTGLPLGEALPFEQGASPNQPPLHLNRSLGILGLTTGMGPARAAASITALGYDPRFDLAQSYFIVAGIAGVDPAAGSIGSVFIPRFLIGLGGGYTLDGIGHVPQARTTPDYSRPWPSESEAIARGTFHALSAPLVEWALEFANSTVQLADSPNLERARNGYVTDGATARRPPSIGFGDSATGDTFWAGRTSTAWARNWTAFYSGGKARFAVTQMEDYAIAQALVSLDRGRRANASRLVVFRSASDYCYPPDGKSVSTWFFGATHMATPEALAAVYAAAAPIASALAAPPDDRTESDAGPDGAFGGSLGLLLLLLLLLLPIVLGTFAVMAYARKRTAGRAIVREVASAPAIARASTSADADADAELTRTTSTRRREQEQHDHSDVQLVLAESK